MMTSYPNMVALIWSVLAAGWAVPVAAQTYERPQPIVLESLPCSCASPARISQRPIVRHAYGDSIMSPTVAENLHAVATASEMVPLPAGPAWSSRPVSSVAPVSAYMAPVSLGSTVQSVQTLRPVTGPSVPEGYVLGRGLIGQPKLFKPGQPMRNLLRYFSL